MANRQENDPLRSNEFECPRCGTLVFHDLLACPKCGQRMYPDDDDLDPEDVATPLVRANSFSISAIGLGWLVASLLAFVVHFVASRLWSPQSIGAIGWALLFVGPPLGGLLGGLLAAKAASAVTSRRLLVLHGLAVALMSLISALLLESYWSNLASQPIRPLALLSWALLLLAGPLGAALEARSLPEPDPSLAEQLFRPVLPPARASGRQRPGPRSSGTPRAANPPSVRPDAARSDAARADPARSDAARPGALGTGNALTPLPETGLSSTEDRLYLDLLARVQYSFETADQLIETERHNSPTLARADCIRRAIAAWDRQH